MVKQRFPRILAAVIVTLLCNVALAQGVGRQFVITIPHDTDITTTSTTTVTIDPRSTTAPKELCESGDANLDGQTTVADAAAILQYIGNRDKYQLTDQGKKNADVDGKKGTTAVPDYIKQRTDYKETYSKNPGGDGPTYYADWSNAELQRFTLQFYTDFALRYGHDARLAFLEVGFGHWSEYHIYGTKLELGKNFPSKDFQKQFFEHMNAVITDIPWAVSIDAADDEYSPVVDDDELMALHFGLFDDSFMHKDHEIGTSDGYNEECWNAIGRDTRWQTGVCGGEISYYSSNDQKNFLSPDGLYGHTWAEQAAKYHITFMIANDAPRGGVATPERFREGSMATGYHFVVKQCQTDGTTTRLLVANEGIAPLYRDAWFAIGDIRSSSTLRGLLPGDECWIEIPTVPNGDGSDIQITSDCILPQQSIEFDADIRPTGMAPITTPPTHQSTFNLTGQCQKFTPTQPGLYIVNGRKILLGKQSRNQFLEGI